MKISICILSRNVLIKTKRNGKFDQACLIFWRRCEIYKTTLDSNASCPSWQHHQKRSRSSVVRSRVVDFRVCCVMDIYTMAACTCVLSSFVVELLIPPQTTWAKELRLPQNLPVSNCQVFPCNSFCFQDSTVYFSPIMWSKTFFLRSL